MVVHAGDNHDMGEGMLAGTPLVAQPSTSAKGDGNDDECDIEGGELHHRMDDPALHGDIAPERHGKEEHGYSGDNKKNAVGDPAAAKDEGASHETKEASIVQANDDHGLDACMEEEIQAVAAQGRASVEAPKSSTGAPTMTCAAKKPVTAAAGKPKKNAAKGSKATPVKAVTPRRKADTQSDNKELAPQERNTRFTPDPFFLLPRIFKADPSLGSSRGYHRRKNLEPRGPLPDSYQKRRGPCA
ncbi:hypothetical protein HPB52_021341 [Rhipicephalus sanguineus]|uniref:Uncharacterized protein n=1 Tax=Rhipicephalus sanguineus TaxID=34632 RepID=A0A9D4SPF3_RHISA|nr:hypothetical protein HPB52_021341 [Rhipicephalus sanguineus]